MDHMPPDRAGAGTPGTYGQLKMAGVPVRFHFTFFVGLALLAAGILGGEPEWAETALFLVAIFVSILLHELAHALVARHRGIGTSAIVMYPVGGVARMARRPAPRDDLWISIAGPAFNLAAGSALLWTAARLEPAAGELATRTGLANLGFGAFNLLPAAPMDGGRIFRAAVALWKGEQVSALAAPRVARGVAILIGLAAIAVGQFLLVVVAFLVYLASYHEGAAAIGHVLTKGLPVRAAMITEFRTVPHGATFRDVANIVLATAQQDIPVLHGEQVVGLLHREAFLNGLAHFGPDAYVSAAMDREFVRLDPAADLSYALDCLPADTHCGLVLDDGRLAGILTRDNVNEFVLLRRLGIPGSDV
ncbi:MAG: site-2 protease family protein [Bryobacteraceae bacterium]